MLWQGRHANFEYGNSLLECDLSEEHLPCLFVFETHSGTIKNRGLNQIQFW